MDCEWGVSGRGGVCVGQIIQGQVYIEGREKKSNSSVYIKDSSAE